LNLPELADVVASFIVFLIEINYYL
jgi:hypothetical protein